MDGDEEVGLGRPADPHPLVERDEHVLVAGHHDPIAPDASSCFRSRWAKLKHDVLLERAGRATAPGSMPP